MKPMAFAARLPKLTFFLKKKSKIEKNAKLYTKDKKKLKNTIHKFEGSMVDDEAFMEEKYVAYTRNGHI